MDIRQDMHTYLCLLLLGVTHITRLPPLTRRTFGEWKWQKYGEVNKRSEKKYMRAQWTANMKNSSERNVLKRTDFDIIHSQAHTHTYYHHDAFFIFLDVCFFFGAKQTTLVIIIAIVSSSLFFVPSTFCRIHWTHTQMSTIKCVFVCIWYTHIHSLQ